MGQDAGLAGARAGEDQERAVGRGDGAGLLRVEAADDLLRRARLRVAAVAVACCSSSRARPLVGRQLGRHVARDRRVAQPVGLLAGGRGRARRRPRTASLAARGVVGRGVRRAPAGRGLTGPL